MDIPEIGSDQFLEIKLSLKRQAEALDVFGSHADMELEASLAKALPNSLLERIQKYRDAATATDLTTDFTPTPKEWREINATRILNS